MNWQRSVCVIIGASSGIGRATAWKIAERGTTVVAVARREERLASLVEELGGPPHSYVVCDVGRLDEVKALAATLAERTDRIDALINSAGIPSRGRLANSTSEDVERVIRVNLLGPIWCTLELMPLLERAPKDNGAPIVVIVASMGGRIAMPGAPIYSASKFGLTGFGESVWGELHEKGISVMNFNPGFVDTEGFPMDALLASPLTRRLVMEEDYVVEALCKGIENGKSEVMTQPWWRAIYVLSVLAQPLTRRIARRVDRIAARNLKV
jgi:short-subunit dehydrogenase